MFIMQTGDCSIGIKSLQTATSHFLRNTVSFDCFAELLKKNDFNTFYV